MNNEIREMMIDCGKDGDALGTENPWNNLISVKKEMWSENGGVCGWGKEVYENGKNVGWFVYEKDSEGVAESCTEYTDCDCFDEFADEVYPGWRSELTED